MGEVSIKARVFYFMVLLQWCYFIITMSSKRKPSTSPARDTIPISLPRMFINRSVSIKRKSTGASNSPTLDLNKLSKELGKKDFPDVIKLALARNHIYQILKCKLNTDGKFGAVLLVDVSRVAGSGSGRGNDKISTYFSVLYTKKLIKKAELQGINLETSPELLIGLKFIYCGEVKSSKGNTYSKLEFCIFQ